MVVFPMHLLSPVKNMAEKSEKRQNLRVTFRYSKGRKRGPLSGRTLECRTRREASINAEWGRLKQQVALDKPATDPFFFRSILTLPPPRRAVADKMRAQTTSAEKSWKTLQYLSFAAHFFSKLYFPFPLLSFTVSSAGSGKKHKAR